MLSHHNATMNLTGVRRGDLSSYDDYRRHATHQRRQHELDELETSKNRQCLKKTTKFLFSHIGLVGLVVVYAVAGAFLFQLLEIREEKYLCLEIQGDQNTEITKLKQEIVNYIQNNATPSTTDSSSRKDNATVAFEKIGQMLLDYRTYIIGISSKQQTYGENCSIVNKWTYPNSLLFAITIITTIGYGNITPMTWEGQLCSICYATIGIPIFLLCLANISGVLGEMFRILYSKIICGPCTFVKKRRARARKAKLEEESGISIDHARPSGWTLNDNNNNKTVAKGLSNELPNDDEIDEEEQQLRNQRTAVPLTVTMIIIALYIWVGSALFHNFEGWTMMQSGYFCFITLSTIGFGDFVPGQQKDEPHADLKLIAGAVYVLFGMAILAMCFDLMQEEIVAKFRWIGTKIGIVEKPEENIDQKDQNNPSTIDSNAPMDTSRTVISNEYAGESPTPRNSSATRKTSPRNNIARVHPMGTSPTNEATLHQRIAATKPY